MRTYIQGYPSAHVFACVLKGGTVKEGWGALDTKVRMIGDMVQKALDMGHNCKLTVLLLYIYASTCTGKRRKQ